MIFIQLFLYFFLKRNPLFFLFFLLIFFSWFLTVIWISLSIYFAGRNITIFRIYNVQFIPNFFSGVYYSCVLFCNVLLSWLLITRDLSLIEFMQMAIRFTWMCNPTLLFALLCVYHVFLWIYTNTERNAKFYLFLSFPPKVL